MPHYHVNTIALPNGDHEVHENGCSRAPPTHNRLTLGYHPDCREAVGQARAKYPRSNGCFACCADCHVG